MLHALGQCLIRTAVTTITPRADMCFALASYLTRERGNRIPRRGVERFFWPTMRSGDAAHSLSELIRKLRGKGVLIQRDEASCIWLPRDGASVDIDSLAAEPLTGMADRDLSILPGYIPRSSPEFSDWVDEWREHMRLRVLDDVVAATARATGARDWPLALALARQALKLEPTNESALLYRARAADFLARESHTAAGTEVVTAGGQGTNARLREATVNPAWRTRPPMSPAEQDAPLVGRELPMRRLLNKAARVLEGAVASAYVSAPAGMGKSRLVREIVGWMRDHGAAVCIVASDRQDGHRPLSAFIEAVPRLQALPGAAGCATSTVECLARITQLTNEAPEMSLRNDSMQLSASIRASVIDLVDAVADEQPLLLVVEDVHWIDPASWSLLRTVAARAQRSVLLICTSRVAWQHGAWGVAEYFRLEELPALDAYAARAHVCNYLTKLDRSADDGYIDWCVETSNCNPYFIEELVNYWVATGEQYTAPPSLVALVEARLAHLRPDALRVIQAAAILGKYSTIGLLQQVLECPTHALFSSIEELGQAGLLTIAGPPETTGAAPVICRHDLIARAATRGLSAHGRALLHHAAARAMESTAADNLSAELLWDCADHWQAAGQTERSVRAAISCARHLHDMGLVDDAIGRCEAALTTAQNESSRVAVLRAMAQSQYVARDWRTFCKTVAEVRILEGASAFAVPCHDDLELCELGAQRNLNRDWNSAMVPLIQCARSTGADALHRVQAAISVFSIATNVGDRQTMNTVYSLVEPLLYSADVRAQDRLMFTMIYHTIQGDGNLGAMTARELLALAERTLPLRYRMGIMLNCASALRRHGAVGEAETVCEDLFHTAVSLGAFDFAADACNRLIEMHIDAGVIDSAHSWVSKYRSLRRPKSELRSQRTLRIALARVHVSREEWDYAGKLLGSSPGTRLWEDGVVMLRSAALATKMRVEMGRGANVGTLARMLRDLAPINESLRTMGAQDYECYSLYLAYHYIKESRVAERLLTTYANEERRDRRPLAPEIAVELARLAL